MKTNLNKEEQVNDWERVFKILPIKTEDGFRVIFGYVWRMETDDPFEPVRYHTNPERKETEYQIERMAKQINGSPIMRPTKRPKKPAPPPAPPAVCPKCGTTDCIPNEEYWKYITPFEPVERSVLFRSCNYRRGRNAVKKMAEAGYFTQGTGPR